MYKVLKQFLTENTKKHSTCLLCPQTKENTYVMASQMAAESTSLASFPGYWNSPGITGHVEWKLQRKETPYLIHTGLLRDRAICDFQEADLDS